MQRVVWRPDPPKLPACRAYPHEDYLLVSPASAMYNPACHCAAL
jgi:hypothetical protein